MLSNSCGKDMDALIFSRGKGMDALSGESGKELVCRFLRLCSCRDVDFDEFVDERKHDFFVWERDGRFVWREWESINRVK